MSEPKTVGVQIDVVEALHDRMKLIAKRQGKRRERVYQEAAEFYADAQEREHELAKEERPLTRKERGK